MCTVHKENSNDTIIITKSRKIKLFVHNLLVYFCVHSCYSEIHLRDCIQINYYASIKTFVTKPYISLFYLVSFTLTTNSHLQKHTNLQLNRVQRLYQYWKTHYENCVLTEQELTSWRFEDCELQLTLLK